MILEKTRKKPLPASFAKQHEALKEQESMTATLGEQGEEKTLSKRTLRRRPSLNKSANA